MTYQAGDWVEGRWGFGPFRTGRVQRLVLEGYDSYYVTADMGMTYIAQGRDLRPAEPPYPLPSWAVSPESVAVLGVDRWRP